MTSSSGPAGELRLERKFEFPPPAFGVEETLRRLPGLFREAYPVRFVNSLYLDTLARGDYLAGVDGQGERRKVRLRWYGALFGSHCPALELKDKHGLAVRKRSYRLGHAEISPAFRSAELRRLLERADLPADAGLAWAARTPSLLTRYRRSYHLSHDRRLRLTVDTDIRAYRWGGSTGLSPAGPVGLGAVLELKYDPADEGRARDLTQALRVRLSRYSKYVRAVETVGA
ncbi:VTC domain-containing protein [Elusimicrobiota bacterium]